MDLHKGRPERPTVNEGEIAQALLPPEFRHARTL